MENNKDKIYGLQFHPEVQHTQNGDKLIEDLRKRLPKIFVDMNARINQKKINAFLKWLYTKALPMTNSSEQSGAIGVYIFSK